MEDKKNYIVEMHDHYGECLQDGLNTKDHENNRPKGYVEIYEVDEKGNKKLVGKPNLVVYMGREWLVSRAFNISNSNIPQVPSEFISWFGVGDAGCPIGDPLTPTSPTVVDSNLGNSVMINPSDISCADYRSSPVAGFYKHPIESTIFEQDPDNYNKWLIVRGNLSLGSADANGYNLNEVGLFTASSNQGGYTGPFHLYARCTFPTIVKYSGRQLLFVWYVYF